MSQLHEPSQDSAGSTSLWESVCTWQGRTVSNLKTLHAGSMCLRESGCTWQGRTVSNFKTLRGLRVCGSQAVLGRDERLVIK